MLCLPSSLNELLLLVATCFSRPTYRTFCALVIGQISQTRLRCVTGMLIGALVSGVWHHARAHRFFSHARWCADELGLRVAEVIVSRLLSRDQPLVVPIDDTLAKRRGRKVFGCFWHHDATANSSKGSLAWGNNWVTAGINVKLPFLERTVCLLVLFRLWRPRRKEIPKHKPDAERPSKPKVAREMLCLLAGQFKNRMIHMVGDAAYASGAFAGLPDNVTITSVLRADAALNELPPPRPPKGSASKAARRRKARGCPSSPRSRPTPPPNGSRRPSVAMARQSRSWSTRSAASGMRRSAPSTCRS